MRSELDEFMTIPETAKWLRRSDDTIREYIANGTLVGKLVVGRYLITRRSVEKLLGTLVGKLETKDMRAPLADTASPMSSTAPYRSRRGAR
jgi:hypothetical protein